jgi:hypothetical protein
MEFNAVEITIYLLGSAGLSFIVTNSMLLKPFRDVFSMDDDRLLALSARQQISGKFEASIKERIFMFIHKFLTCPLCFGFWAALLLWWIHCDVFTYALAGSIVSYFIYSKVA